MKKLNSFFAKIIILLSITVFSKKTLLSQTFVNPGAEWLFRGTISGGPTYYMRWKYEENVSIDTLIYQKISQERKNIWGVLGAPIVTINLDPFLFRSSGDSLFISEIDGSNEKLLYDFTPLIGNTWDATPLINWYTIEPTSPLFIETIGFGDTTINGIQVNWIEVESSNPDSLVFNGRIYNHYGKEQIAPFWNDGTLDIQPLAWSCYKDDLLGEINSSECFNYETLSTTHLDNPEIQIIPNYLNQKLEIKCYNINDLKLISLTDLSGKILTERLKIVDDYIEFNKPEGIYIINLKMNELTFSKKFYWSNKY
jgi:hypothetical protein